MGNTDTMVVILGVVVLIIGAIIVVGYYDARERAQEAGQQSLFGSLEAIGIMIQWMSDSFSLLILNTFVTGLALITSGIGLRRANQINRE